MKAVMGIDVGFSGGIAVIVNGRVVAHMLMPTKSTDVGNELDYKAIMEAMAAADIIYIEKAQAFPKNGAVQAFKYGGGFYALRCLATVMDKRTTYVNPQSWKKVMLQDMDKNNKQSSITRAKQLFPYIPDGIKDGVAEAILIAEYGRRLEEHL